MYELSIMMYGTANVVICVKKVFVSFFVFVTYPDMIRNTGM